MTPPPLPPPEAAEALAALIEAPGSPIWTHPREDLLTAAMRRDVADFARLVVTDPPRWTAQGPPVWLWQWLVDVWPRVPALARQGPIPDTFADVPTTAKADLARDHAAHVPRGAPLEELIAYTTSGTAGPLVTVPSHPVTTANYIPLVLAAARPAVTVTTRRNALDWVTVISQEAGGFIVPSWSSTLGSLMAQVQLRAHGWMDGDGPVAFLEAHDPRVLTGDPVAFAHLLELDPDLRPALLVSTATVLSRGLRDRLEARWGAPVLDMYSLTESGPVAASLNGDGGHRLLQPRLYVEVVDEDGRALPAGERGEVTLTGGMNPALPLVRYRTGDHAALAWPDAAAAPMLVGLEGRTPVVFRAPGGGTVNSHSVTVALRPLALPRFTVRQLADDQLAVAVDDPEAPEAARIATLLAVPFGAGVRVELTRLETGGGKLVPFTVDPPSA